MSEQEITTEGYEISARELEMWADARERQGQGDVPWAYRSAARTIRRLEGEVAETEAAGNGAAPDFAAQLRGVLADMDEYEADAELGSLVRRWRDHPETCRDDRSPPCNTLPAGACNVAALSGILESLDTLAQRRAAEEGERGPSGWCFRMRGGVLERKGTEHWCTWHAADIVATSDLDVVERVRKGVPRGE